MLRVACSGSANRPFLAAAARVAFAVEATLAARTWMSSRSTLVSAAASFAVRRSEVASAERTSARWRSASSVSTVIDWLDRIWSLVIASTYMSSRVRSGLVVMMDSSGLAAIPSEYSSSICCPITSPAASASEMAAAASTSAVVAAFSAALASVSGRLVGDRRLDELRLHLGGPCLELRERQPGQVDGLGAGRRRVLGGGGSARQRDPRRCPRAVGRPCRRRPWPASVPRRRRTSRPASVPDATRAASPTTTAARSVRRGRVVRWQGRAFTVGLLGLGWPCAVGEGPSSGDVRRGDGPAPGSSRRSHRPGRGQVQTR